MSWNASILWTEIANFISMSHHDVRCSVSGVSLLGSECALVLLTQRVGEPDWHLASLPLWGTYLGTGSIEDVNCGANAEIVFEAFLEAVAAGELKIAWAALGMNPYRFECIEDVLTLLACARIHAPEAISWGNQVVSYALIEAHFVAALMSREPTELGELQIEALPDAVLAKAVCGQRIYSRLGSRSLKQKCQFGLSFLGLAAFIEALENLQRRVRPAGPFFAPEPGQKERWLAEALVTFAHEQDTLEALEEYAGQEQDEEASCSEADS